VWFDTLLLWIIYAWAEFGRYVNEMDLSCCVALLCFVLDLVQCSESIVW
jgi:hypothetical protein